MLRVALTASLFSCAITVAQDNPAATAPGGQQQPGANPQVNLDRAAGILFPGGSRGAVISGRVLFSDGTSPSGRARVQRICGVSVVQETYTDSEGRFSLFQGSSGINVDASSKDATRGNGSGGGGRGGGGTSSEANSFGCELLASLQGYRSESLPIGVRHEDSNRDVGAIILHPLVGVHGLTVSATTALAPKEAQKSYERGLDAIRHNQPDLAQSEFSRAAGLFPRFAAAWFELGQVYERRGHRPEARNAYAKAIAADRDFLNPYERLYLLDIAESKWQEAADASNRVIHRDPYDFPGAYYINALANLQLRNLDAAERSAREAGRLPNDTVDPRANYVLGLVLARQGRTVEAIESLQAFLNFAPSGAELKDAERILANMETRLRNQAAREKQRSQSKPRQ